MKHCRSQIFSIKPNKALDSLNALSISVVPFLQVFNSLIFFFNETKIDTPMMYQPEILHFYLIPSW